MISFASPAARQRLYVRLSVILFTLILPLSFVRLVLSVDGDDEITTIAGDGTAGFSGDGGQATDASLNAPAGVKFLPPSQVLIADTSNHRVRMIDVSGVITTIAGTGTSGYSGDGGPATNAQLNFPYDISVNEAGEIIIADTQNNRLRQIDVSGVITTIAGTGVPGSNGDGGQAAAAEVSVPQSVAIDANGNIIFADTGNHKVRMIDVSGVITTLAGTGETGFSGDGGSAAAAQLNFPGGITIDAAGQIYIADTNNHRIRMIDVSGVITTIAGTGGVGSAGDGGLATNAMLNFPAGLTFDNDGNLFIADQFSSKVRMIDVSGVITTIAGTGASGFSGDGGAASAARLRFPGDVALDDQGNLLIADTSNQRIRQVSAPATPVISEILTLPPILTTPLSFPTTDGVITVAIRPGTFPPTADKLQYIPRGILPSTPIKTGLPQVHRFGPVFELNLLDDGNQPLASPTFSQPITIEVNYTEADMLNGPFFKEGLRVYFYDPITMEWIDIPIQKRDIPRKTLTFEIDHFTEFAVVDTRLVYLPLAIRP